MGSSPLARGLRGHVRGRDGRPGIIPARAGFTEGDLRHGEAGQDHPRSRGVYWVCRRSCCGSGGSSPLARGLPLSVAVRERLYRIIPARAGFTGRVASGLRPSADHPRSRGVYSVALDPSAACGGSSPLARGLPRRGLVGLPAVGIIPARAGFTRQRAPRPPSQPDHPRSRGVYAAAPHDRPTSARIIPARAGFTASCPRSSSPEADHPRSRGVYSRSLVCDWLTVGSSPLARGLHEVRRALDGQVRIIPARAGFT